MSYGLCTSAGADLPGVLGSTDGANRAALADQDERVARHERGKDLGVIGRLLKSNPPERVHAKMLLFFKSDARWIVDGYRLAVFEKTFNGLGMPQTDAVTRNAMATRQQLQDEIVGNIGRSTHMDYVARVPTWIDFALKWLSREEPLRELEETDTSITTSSGAYAYDLPAGTAFIGFVDVISNMFRLPRNRYINSPYRTE